MSHSQRNEQDELEKYLEKKAKQDKQNQQQQEADSLSEYEACVLRESARVKELITEAQAKSKDD